jgi:CDP-diacylglycerol--serine O-phosphatidyltransferase
MEDQVPRAPWQRRRTTDSDRPAGRRWAGRLRSARQALRVGRRRTENATTTSLIVPGDSRIGLSRLPARLPRLRLRRRDGAAHDVVALAPYAGASTPTEPAFTGKAAKGSAANAAEEPPALSIPLLPGQRTLGRRIRFAIVNGFTISSIVLGMTAIFLAVNHSDVHWAAGCLIFCVAFDGLDGALARKLGVASPFGAQMDSLADMCSFGLAAPVVVYAWLAGTAPRMLIVPACALVAVCAAIRLARFNVSPKDGRFFCGVPTTMVAAVLASATLISPAMPAGLRVAGVVVLGLAMVSSFPYVKLARLLRLPPWMLVLPVLGAIVDYRFTFVAIVLAYLVSGPVIWLRQRGRTRLA